MSEARSSIASCNTWLTKRMMEARPRRRRRGWCPLGVFIHDLEAVFLVERADGVRADAEAFFHLALDGFAGGEDRLEVQAGQRLERVQPLRGEQPAGGDFDRAVDALEREQFLLQQNARGKQREKLAIRLDVFQRREVEAVFLRQPAQNVLLGLDGGLCTRASVSASIEDNCRAATMRSSNCFRDASMTAFSLILR